MPLVIGHVSFRFEGKIFSALLNSTSPIHLSKCNIVEVNEVHNILKLSCHLDERRIPIGVDSQHSVVSFVNRAIASPEFA